MERERILWSSDIKGSKLVTVESVRKTRAVGESHNHYAIAPSDRMSVYYKINS